jgi:hypothetical protein
MRSGCPFDGKMSEHVLTVSFMTQARSRSRRGEACRAVPLPPGWPLHLPLPWLCSFLGSTQAAPQVGESTTLALPRMSVPSLDLHF